MTDSPTPPAEQAGQARPRLLLVDDDADDRAVIVRALAAAGLDFEIVEAANAGQALARLNGDGFAIALVNADLPDGDRVQVLRRAREAEVDFPIIMLSAHADEQTAVELIKAGAADYLPKRPLSPGRLDQSIRAALRLHTAERDALRAEALVRRHAGQVDELARAAVRMSAALDVEKLLEEAAHSARTILGTHEAMVTFAPDGDWVRATTRQSLSERYAEYRSLVPDPDRSGLLASVRTGRHVIRLDAGALAEHPAFRAPAPDEDWLLPLRGWLAAPLLGRGGHNIGVLQLSDRTDGDFVPGDEAILVQLAQLVSASLENARLFAVANEAALARERVLATVSHDLRNPLNTILMGTGLLLEGTLSPDDAHRQLTIIQRSVATMNRMIQDLLDVSSIEAGHLSIEPTEIDCASAVQDVCDMLEPIALKNNVRLACVLADTLPAVRADRDRLVQVFSNLVGNAIKFSDPGGLVEIAAEDGGDEVRFAVRDQGPGIASKDLRHIFEPFWQGDDATAPQGAGIGLTIARGIVEAHGGHLTCESEPGRGTTFHFTLPTPASAAAA